MQKSDFDDFSGKNVTVFGIKAHQAKFLFYFEGSLGIHKICKDLIPANPGSKVMTKN